MWPVVLVFVATYGLIAARRLSMLPIGRPAGALAGASAMVVLFAIDPRWGLSPKDASAAVEPNTIGLLLGMMLLSAALAEAGFFDGAAEWVAQRSLSPALLLYVVTGSAGLLSAFLVNDSVCVMLTPLVDRMARRARLPRVPYLLALAMGSNAGSAMTLAGNPQNMLVAHLSGLSYRQYLLHAGPAALLGLGATAGVLHLLFRSRIRRRDGESASSARPPAPPLDPARARLDVRITFACIVAVSVGFLLGANLAWTALVGATAVIILRGRDPGPLFARVSWTVLLFFGALFVVVAGLQRTGLPAEALAAIEPWFPSGRAANLAWLSGALTIGCQIVSNVPFILLAEPWIRTQHNPQLAWVTTALVTTLAGNLTMLGSVANIIVIEESSAQDEIGFWTYLKVGLPVTLASTVIALAYLLATW